MKPSTSSKAAAEAERGERALEVLAVLLLGIATIGSAWCGYQATRWNTEQAELSQEALDAQVEGAQLFGLATQVVSYDSNLVAQYARAIVDGDDELAEFYRETLIRPGFLPTLERWEEQLAAGGEAPPNLLTDETYLDEQLGDYRSTQARSEAATLASRGGWPERRRLRADDVVVRVLAVLRRRDDLVPSALRPHPDARQLVDDPGLRSGQARRVPRRLNCR